MYLHGSIKKNISSNFPAACNTAGKMLFFLTKFSKINLGWFYLSNSSDRDWNTLNCIHSWGVNTQCHNIQGDPKQRKIDYKKENMFIHKHYDPTNI